MPFFYISILERTKQQPILQKVKMQKLGKWGLLEGFLSLWWLSNQVTSIPYSDQEFSSKSQSKKTLYCRQMFAKGKKPFFPFFEVWDPWVKKKIYKFIPVMPCQRASCPSCIKIGEKCYQDCSNCRDYVVPLVRILKNDWKQEKETYNIMPPYQWWMNCRQFLLVITRSSLSLNHMLPTSDFLLMLASSV